MTLSMPETTVRPIHRVARELSESSGFLLARLGLGFKTRAMARVEGAGGEDREHAVVVDLAAGGLDPRDRARLEAEAEPGEKEAAALGHLPGDPVNRAHRHT